MKEYEVIHEIFNQCPGNKTRDQFIEEIEIEETPEEWVRRKFKNEKELRLEKVEKEDGTVVIDDSVSERFGIRILLYGNQE